MTATVEPIRQLWSSMASVMVLARDIPSGLKAAVMVGFGQHSQQKLSTDTIGNLTLTLTNLVVGSAIRIELQAAGTLVEYRVAASTSEVFTVPVYDVGSAGNDLRIKVRKGTTAPKYQPFETLATAAVGSQSVYIAQVADPIA